MEEQRIWKVPFATAEATTFTPVEPLYESASSVGDSPQSTKMYGLRQNIRRDSSSFSCKSKTMVAPYTSDTYLPVANNSRKLLVQGQYYPDQKDLKIVVKKSVSIVTDRNPHWNFEMQSTAVQSCRWWHGRTRDMESSIYRSRSNNVYSYRIAMWKYWRWRRLSSIKKDVRLQTKH